MTDNAHKLSMGEMHDICKWDGIKLHTTVPYHPASNSVAERTIGALTSAVRATLRIQTSVGRSIRHRCVCSQ